MTTKFKEGLMNIFLDKQLLWSVLAIILIYPLFYTMQFHHMIKLTEWLLLIPFSYFSCVILSIPFKLIIK